MKKKSLMLILAASLVLASAPVSLPMSSVYAAEAKSITAENLTFTSNEKTAKKLNFSFSGFDIKRLGFEFANPGVFTAEFTDGNEILVTPVDIGSDTLRIFDRDDESIYAEVKVSVWEDRLPSPANVNFSVSTTSSSLTITNNSTNVPSGAVFEYSLNNVVFQDSNEFKGLEEDTEYSIYTRVKVQIDGKSYYINKSDNPVIKAKTLTKEEEGPEIHNVTLGDITIKEGTVYEINTTNFKGKSITYRSDNESIATVADAKIAAKAPGTTSIYLIVDSSTAEKQIIYYYKYNLKVSEKLRVKFTAAAKNDKVIISCENRNANGYTAKFSFDQNTWSDSLTLTRSTRYPETTVYGCFFDSEGYYRSEIEKVVLNTQTSEKNVSEKGEAVAVEAGKKCTIKNTEKESDSLTFSYKSSDTKTAHVSGTGVVTGIKAGKATVTYTVKTYSFDTNGNQIITTKVVSYPVTVSEPKAEDEDKNDVDEDSDSDKDKGKDGSKNDSNDGSKSTGEEKKLVLAVPTIVLKDSYFIYNGKVQTPEFTVKISGKKIKSSLYTVTYSKGRKKVGRYCITVKMKPESGYTGTKRYYYYIMPKKMTGLKVKKLSSGKAKVQWKKGSAGITGYEIQYAKSGIFKSYKTIKVKNAKTIAKTCKIPKGRYVRVRAYYYSKESKKTVYGQWSNIRKVK